MKAKPSPQPFDLRGTPKLQASGLLSDCDVFELAFKFEFEFALAVDGRGSLRALDVKLRRPQEMGLLKEKANLLAPSAAFEVSKDVLVDSIALGTLN